MLPDHMLTGPAGYTMVVAAGHIQHFAEKANYILHQESSLVLLYIPAGQQVLPVEYHNTGKSLNHHLLTDYI